MLFAVLAKDVMKQTSQRRIRILSLIVISAAGLIKPDRVAASFEGCAVACSVQTETGSCQAMCEPPNCAVCIEYGSGGGPNCFCEAAM
jgi:hypothetical protein